MFPSRAAKSRYEIREPIAHGGMGVVYKAYDKEMKRTVALKTLLDLSDSRALQLFKKECEDLTALSHPNIVPIYDVGKLEDDGGKPFLVMPLLTGVTLEKLIDSSSSRLTVERCVDIFCQTCRGLQAAHERGLIHRDLKPSNIFVMEDDSIRIIDFGVAHRVHTSHTIGRKGTLPYMSPEQVEMKALTPASDIFSAAVTFYEGLTRRKVFHRSNDEAVAQAIRNYIPPPAHEINPEVPVALSKAIHKGMAKDPSHRYRSAREFSEIIQKAARGELIDIFNPGRIRPRLDRARQAFAANDLDFAGEIVSELKSEGHIEPDIDELDQAIERAQIQRRTSQLIETARSRIDEGEYQIALQKVEEALLLDPRNMDALALKARIDTKRTERDVEGWISIARNHIDNKAFGPARDALKRALELRPREAKANQLMTELERLEQSYFRSREEKERLYNAAMQADQNGDISSAVSKLERVLELDKASPDVARTSQYQRLYEKVRSEYEASKNAWTAAKRLLDAGKFAQALAVCNENIVKRPNETTFKALKVEIEEKHRQFVSARIAETDKQVEAEPDLDRRVAILEKALSENPGEAHFERSLQNAREKRDMVAAIIARARSYEENEQFQEAIAQWEIVQSIYPRYPALSIEIDRLSRMRDQSRRREAKVRWVEQIDHMLETGNEVRALELLRMAREEIDDPEFVQLERLAQDGLRRRERAHALLAEGKAACERGAFESGVSALREAYDLDGRDEQIRDLLVQALVEEGRRLIDSNPQQATDLLTQVLDIEPGHALAKGLLKLLADQRRSESLDGLIAAVREMQAEGRLGEAYERVSEGVRDHPNEARLMQLQSVLKRALQDMRKKDLDQVQRLDRELESTSALDSHRAQDYEQRFNRYMTQYPDDEEMKRAVNGARRRLQTMGPGMTSAGVENSEQYERDSDPGVDTESRNGGPAVVSEIETIGERRDDDSGPIIPPRRPIDWSRYKMPGLAAAGVLVLVIASTLLFRHKPAPVVIPSTAAIGSLEVTAQPSGVQVTIDGQSVAGDGSKFHVEEKPGSYTIDVRKPGYKPFTQPMSFVAGRSMPLSVTLLPEDPMLRVAGTAKVFLDGDTATEVKDGEPQLPLPAGDHTVRIQMSATSQTSFKLHVDRDGLAQVSDLTAREMNPLIVSSFGTNAKLYGLMAPGSKVQAADQVIGNLSPDGLTLPDVTTAGGELVIGDGKDAKKMTVESNPGRMVVAQIEADPNVGALLVSANEDGATVVLTVNGKEYRRATVAKGQAKFANVRARAYSVQISKAEFEDVPPQQVTIAKGQTQNLQFNLVHKAELVTLKIGGEPGVRFWLDNDRTGVHEISPSGFAEIQNLSPGQHMLNVVGGRYRPTQRGFNVPNGDRTASYKISGLELAPGTLVVRRSPAAVVITCRKDGQDFSLSDGPNALPEGKYEFIASARGFVSKRAKIDVKPGETQTFEAYLDAETPTGDPMERFWGKGQWRFEDGWYTRKGDILLPQSRSGDVQFDAQVTESGPFGRKRKISWVTNSLDGGNRVQYELADGHLQVMRVSNGHKAKVASVDLGGKVAEYRVRLEIRADHVGVFVQGEKVANLTRQDLDGLESGNFGFSGNKEVKIANFSWAAR